MFKQISNLLGFSRTHLSLITFERAYFSRKVAGPRNTRMIKATPEMIEKWERREEYLNKKRAERGKPREPDLERQRIIERMRSGEDLSKNVVFDEKNQIYYSKDFEEEVKADLAKEAVQKEEPELSKEEKRELKKLRKQERRKNRESGLQLESSDLKERDNDGRVRAEKIADDSMKEELGYSTKKDRTLKQTASKEIDPNDEFRSKTPLRKHDKIESVDGEDEIKIKDTKFVEKNKPASNEDSSLKPEKKNDERLSKLLREFSEDNWEVEVDESSDQKGTKSSRTSQQKEWRKPEGGDNKKYDPDFRINLNDNQEDVTIKKPQKTKMLAHEMEKLSKFTVKVDPKSVEQIENQLEKTEFLKKEEQKNLMDRINRESLPKIQKIDKALYSLRKKKDTSRFYRFLDKFDKDIIIQLLSHNELLKSNPQKYIPKFLVLLNYLRFNKMFTIYNRKDIFGIIEAILENVDSLKPLEVTSLAVSMGKMKIDNPGYFKPLEAYVMSNSAKFDLRSLSHIVYSFAPISLTQSIMADFSEMYKHLETVISMKLQTKTPKDICQIAIGYSKTQNFSQEFLYVIEQSAIDLFTKLNPQETTILAYTFVKNDYSSPTFNRLVKESFLRRPEKFNIGEIALLCEVFDKWEMLDEKLFKLIEKQFLLKSENLNAQDAAIFSKILLSTKYSVEEDTKRKIVEVCNLLFHSIDGNCIAKIMSNFAEKYQNGVLKQDFVTFCLRKFKSLRRSNKVRGIHLQRIESELKAVDDQDFKVKVRKIYAAS